jgi:hypothetical protein
VLSICGISFKSGGTAFLVKKVERMCKAVIKANGGYFEEFKIGNAAPRLTNNCHVPQLFPSNESSGHVTGLY